MSNYNLSDFRIMTDQGGFILGQSLLGVDVIRTSGNEWVDKTAGFTSVSTARSVSVDQGVFLQPESGAVVLTTTDTSWLTGAIGRRISVQYFYASAWQVIAEAVIDSVSASVALDDQGNAVWQVTVTASDAVDNLNNFAYPNFGYDQFNVTGVWDGYLTDVQQDTVNIYPGGALASWTAVDRGIDWGSILINDSISALEVIQLFANTQMVPAFANKNGRVQISGPSTTLLALSDDVTVTGYTAVASYTDLEFDNDNDYVVGTVIANSELVDTNGNALYSGMFTPTDSPAGISQVFTLYISSDAQLQAWADNVPGLTFNQLVPTSADMPFDAGIATNLELVNLLDVYVSGSKYACAVGGINHSITPDKWTTALDLLPAQVVTQKGSIAVPNPVNQFSATTTTTTSMTFVWKPPTGSTTTPVTNFVIRRNAGTTAPTSPTAGTSVASLATNVLTATDTGLTGNTVYAYSIFATTAVSGVYSDPQTWVSRTAQATPNAVQSLTATATGPDVTVSFTPPSNPTAYNLENYLIRWNIGGGASYPTSLTGNDGALNTKNLSELITFKATSGQKYWISAWARNTVGTLGTVAHVTITT